MSNVKSSAIADLVAANAQNDLLLIRQIESGEGLTHHHPVVDRYIHEHPLGFLAETSPVIAQSMQIGALRNDVVLNLQVYNTVNGGFRDSEQQISELRRRSSADFCAEIPQIVTGIHRNVLTSTREQFQQMAVVAEKLWSGDQKIRANYSAAFHDAAAQLDRAVSALDAGDALEASTILRAVLENNQQGITHFQWHAQLNDYWHYGAEVGVGLATGAAAYFSGGLALGYMGVAEGAGMAGTSLSAMLASMGASGIAMTLTNRTLNHFVFDTRLLAPGNTADKAVDLLGDTLTNTAFAGTMRIAAVPLAATPVLNADTTLVSNLLMGTSTLAYDFGTITAFNATTTGFAHLSDPAGHPSFDQAFTPEALSHSFGVLLGMRTVVATPNAVAKSAAYLKANGPYIPLAPLPLMIGAQWFSKSPVRWLDQNLRNVPIWKQALLVSNASLMASVGLRYLVSMTLPGFASAHPDLFVNGADFSFFNIHNLFTTFLQANGLNMLVAYPVFTGKGMFDPAIASARMDPFKLGKDEKRFDQMTASDWKSLYVEEAVLRGLFGIKRAIGLQFGKLHDDKFVDSFAGRWIGFSLDTAANALLDVGLAKLFNSEKTVAELLGPSLVISALVGYANTVLTQSEFTVGEAFLRRAFVGLGKGSIYRGLCTSSTVTPTLNMALQITYGVLAITYAKFSTHMHHAELERVRAPAR